MKLITLTLISLLFFSLSYAQDNEKAPFGGELIDQSDLTIVERSDGSQFMCINGKKWILFKKSNSNDPLPVPNHVVNNKISTTIYTSISGQDYISYDGYYWLKMEKNNFATKIESKSIDGIMKVTKKPVNPADKSFSIGLYLSENANITFSIVDLQGNEIYKERINLSKGYHNINKDISKISTGTYIYRFATSKQFISDVIIVSR